MRSGLHEDVLDPADGMGRRARVHGSDIKPHRPRIEHHGDLAAQRGIDRGFDPPRGGEIRLAQRDPHSAERGKLEIDLPLHPGARRDHAGGRHPLDDGRRLPLGDRPARDDRSLCHGIDLSIRGIQGRHDQCAAQQALGIANRRNRHVDLAAGSGEGRKRGGHENRGHVLGAELFTGYVHTQTFKDVRHDLFGEGGISYSVAGSVQADHETMTHEIVPANTVKLNQVLDPNLAALRHSGQRQQQGENERKPHRIYPTSDSRPSRTVAV